MGARPGQRPETENSVGEECMPQEKASGGMSIFGIRIRVHTLTYAGIIAFSLVLGFLVLPRYVPGRQVWEYLVTGAIIVGILAVSLVAHELAHSMAALSVGIPVPEIGLYIFGGLSRIQLEADRPRDDFFIAVVGPLVSAVLAGVFWLLAVGLPLSRPSLRWMILLYGTYFNVILALFNLVPALPLDGGRMLRAVFWAFTGSMVRGTQWAAWGGQVFGAAIVVWGLYQMLSMKYMVGAWNAVVGLFLMKAAKANVHISFLNAIMKSYSVEQAMVEGIPTISDGASIDEVVRDAFLRYRQRAFLVEENDRVVGILTMDQVQGIPVEEWTTTRVRDLMEADVDRYFVRPGARMTEAYLRMQNEKIDRVFVGTREDVRGLVTATGLQKYAEFWQLLHVPAPASGVAAGKEPT